MNDYRLTFSTPTGEQRDVTERVAVLSWSGSVKKVSRQLTATVATPNDGSLPTLPCELGDEVRLEVEGKQVFLGNLVGREKATDAVTTELTALDRGRFLSGNEGWYQFRDTTPEVAVQAVCAGLSIPVGALAATGVRVSRKYPGVSLSRIVDSLYTLAAGQTGKRYLSRFNGAGALEVVEKPTQASLEIAPGKNLQTLRISEDISGLQNSVAVYTDGGRLVRVVDDGESVALFGQFQHVLTQKKGEDAHDEAKKWLEDHALQQTMVVECLGHPTLITGNAVVLRDNAAGVAGLCWIDSDTHTWKNGQYFCRLGLNFRNLMNETTAGREP